MPTTASARPSGLRERNRLDKRQRIREATRELFSTHGFEATTLRQIAERAQVGLGTLFDYAQDKRDLTFLLFNDDLARLVDEAIAASARETRRPRADHGDLGASLPLLRAGSGTVPDSAAGHVFLRRRGRGARFNDTTNRLRGHLTDVVASARARRLLTRSASTADMSALLFSAFASSVRGWLLEETPVASEGLATLRRRLKLLLRAFVPTRAPAQRALRSGADAKAGTKRREVVDGYVGGTQ